MKTKHIPDYPVPGGAAMCGNCGEQNYETIYCNEGEVMPNAGEEIMLSEIEMDIMSVFVKRKILEDDDVIAVLRQLAHRLGDR